MPKKMNEKVSNMNANEPNKAHPFTYATTTSYGDAAKMSDNKPNKGHFSDFLPKTNGEYLTSDNVAINKDLLQEKAMKDLNARMDIFGQPLLSIHHDPDSKTNDLSERVGRLEYELNAAQEQIKHLTFN